MSDEEELRSTRSGKNKKTHKKRKVRKRAVVLIVCILLFLIGAGVAFAWLHVKPPTLNEPEEETREDGIYNVLVVGTDKVGLNTDTIMVMSLDSINNRANVMSIPRDTMSNVKRSVKKINSAYGIGAKDGKGNIDNLKKEVSYLLGFEVDNYVVVNLVAFEEIIDEIGGVTIDVPREMNYDDPYQDLHIHIDEGEQHLNGQEAIGFCRYRSGYAEGDIGRVKAQQLFIEAVAKQLASPSTLTKVPALAEIVLRNMDTDLTNGEIVWFAKEALNVDMSTNLNMFILPGEGRYVNRLSYYLPDGEEILKIVNEYFNPYEEPITELNVVDLDRISYEEDVRQSNLSSEEKRQEQALQEEEGGLEGPVEPGKHPENNHNPSHPGNNGGNGNHPTPQPPTPQPEPPAPQPPVPDNPEPPAPPVEPSQPNTPPGETFY